MARGKQQRNKKAKQKRSCQGSRKLKLEILSENNKKGKGEKNYEGKSMRQWSINLIDLITVKMIIP